jgi:hypothetical protein
MLSRCSDLFLFSFSPRTYRLQLPLFFDVDRLDIQFFGKGVGVVHSLKVGPAPTFSHSANNPLLSQQISKRPE